MADGLQNRAKYPSPCFAMRRCSFSLTPLPKLALGAAAALAAISLSPGSAQAYVVTGGGVQYDVTSFTGSYNDNTSKFQTAANGGMMPWWGNDSAAVEFASAVGTQVGTQSSQPGAVSAFFGYSRYIDPVDDMSSYLELFYTNNGNTQYASWPTGDSSLLWAQATLYTPVPGPLPLFGAGAAFGFSRQLRKRIKLAPAALGSALPLA